MVALYQLLRAIEGFLQWPPSKDVLKYVGHSLSCGMWEHLGPGPATAISSLF